jgi:hypothetical protein
MQVERYNPRKKTNPLLMGCGCLFVGLMMMGVVVLIALVFFQEPIKVAVLQIAGSTVGLEAVGDVDTVLNSTVQPVPQLENPQPVEDIVLNTGGHSQTLDTSSSDYTVVAGEVNEQPQLQISFDEAGLLAQCQQFTQICSQENSQISNASFDLKPNAVIIRGQFELQPGLWQEAGLVMQVQNENQLSVLGLEVGGSIFAATSPELNALMSEAGTQVNSLLQNLTAQAGGTSYTLSSIIADESNLTLIMR